MKFETDWSRSGVVDRRHEFFAASQRWFQPYRKTLILKQRTGQHLWNEADNRYIDLLAMNVSISVGHTHPDVTCAVQVQAETLQHCTIMFFHAVPAQFCEELVAMVPLEHKWVVHFTNSGAEAIDLALMMARTYTGWSDITSRWLSWSNLRSAVRYWNLWISTRCGFAWWRTLHNSS